MLALTISIAGCSTRSNQELIAFDALLAGQPVQDSSPSEPIELRHEEITELTLLMLNTSDQPVTVSHVRLEGELLGLIFLTYDTGIDVTIEPGQERVVRFPIDFFDLEGQAHGLMRGQLTLYDADRTTLGAQPLVVDGRGNLTSTMMVFNLVLALFAVVSLGWNLHRVSLGRVPENRALRGLRFVHTGVAVGLTLAAASSTLRIWPLSTPWWLAVTAIGGVIGFVLGFLSPGPENAGQFPVINLTDERAPMPVPTGPATPGTGQVVVTPFFGGVTGPSPAPAPAPAPAVTLAPAGPSAPAPTPAPMTTPLLQAGPAGSRVLGGAVDDTTGPVGPTSGPLG